MENTPLPLFKKRRAKDIQKQYDCFNAKMFSFTQMGIKIFPSVKSLDRSGQSMNNKLQYSRTFTCEHDGFTTAAT